MTAPADPPPQLARFPAEIHDAYRRFVATKDPQAVDAIVQAALIDFLPKQPGENRNHTPEAKSRLMEDLGYDSLAIAELVFFFEDLFKVTISTEEIRNVSTVGELHAFVARTLAASHPPP